MKIITKLNIRNVFILLSISLIYIIPRVISLGFDVINIDYPLWDNRSTNFFIYLKSQNFIEMYRTNHPGVTLMWVAGGAIEVFSRFYNHFFNEFPVINDMAVFPWRSMFIKLCLVFSIFLLSIFTAYLINKVFNKKAAILWLILIAIEPYLFVHDRLFHLDGLLTAFMFLALISTLLYEKEKKFIWVLITALASALAFLTKATGIFSALFFVFTYLVTSYQSKKMYELCKITGLFLLLFTAFCILFFPAAWVDPVGVFAKIFSESLFASDFGHNQYYLGKWTDSPGFFYYPLVFSFKSSPVMLVSLLAMVVFALSKKFRQIWIDRKKINTSLALVSLYILLYLVEITLSSKKVPRYILPTLPALLLLASYYWTKVERRFLAILLIAMLYQIIYVAKINPQYYLAYTNPLAGGMKIADYLIGNKHFGFGLLDVAEYMNKKPYANEIKLIFDGDGSIGPFYRGMSRNETYIYRDNVLTADYFLLPYYLVDKDPMYIEYKKDFILEKVFNVNAFPYWYLFRNVRIN